VARRPRVAWGQGLLRKPSRSDSCDASMTPKSKDADGDGNVGAEGQQPQSEAATEKQIVESKDVAEANEASIPEKPTREVSGESADSASGLSETIKSPSKAAEESMLVESDQEDEPPGVAAAQSDVVDNKTIDDKAAFSVSVPMSPKGRSSSDDRTPTSSSAAAAVGPLTPTTSSQQQLVPQRKKPGPKPKNLLAPQGGIMSSPTAGLVRSSSDNSLGSDQMAPARKKPGPKPKSLQLHQQGHPFMTSQDSNQSLSELEAVGGEQIKKRQKPGPKPGSVRNKKPLAPTATSSSAPMYEGDEGDVADSSMEVAGDDGVEHDYDYSEQRSSVPTIHELKVDISPRTATSDGASPAPISITPASTSAASPLYSGSTAGDAKAVSPVRSGSASAAGIVSPSPTQQPAQAQAQSAGGQSKAPGASARAGRGGGRWANHVPSSTSRAGRGSKRDSSRAEKDKANASAAAAMDRVSIEQVLSNRSERLLACHAVKSMFMLRHMHRRLDSGTYLLSQNLPDNSEKWPFPSEAEIAMCLAAIEDSSYDLHDNLLTLQRGSLKLSQILDYLENESDLVDGVRESPHTTGRSQTPTQPISGRQTPTQPLSGRQTPTQPITSGRQTPTSAQSGGRQTPTPGQLQQSGNNQLSLLILKEFEAFQTKKVAALFTTDTLQPKPEFTPVIIQKQNNKRILESCLSTNIIGATAEINEQSLQSQCYGGEAELPTALSPQRKEQLMNDTNKEMGNNRAAVAQEIRRRKLAKQQAWDTLSDRYLNINHYWSRHVEESEKEQAEEAQIMSNSSEKEGPRLRGSLGSSLSSSSLCALAVASANAVSNSININAVLGPNNALGGLGGGFGNNSVDAFGSSRASSRLTANSSGALVGGLGNTGTGAPGGVGGGGIAFGGVGSSQSALTNATNIVAGLALNGIDVAALKPEQLQEQINLQMALQASLPIRIKRGEASVPDMVSCWNLADRYKAPLAPKWDQSIREFTSLSGRTSNSSSNNLVDFDANPLKRVRSDSKDNIKKMMTMRAMDSEAQASPRDGATTSGGNRTTANASTATAVEVFPMCVPEPLKFVSGTSNRFTADGKTQLCANMSSSQPCPPNCNCLRTLDLQQRYQRVWSDMEKAIFVDKFMQFPKNFPKIASFLTNRSTQDCIKFYYDSKTEIHYKQLLREFDNRKRNVKIQWVQSTDAAESVGSRIFPPHSGGESREPIVELPIDDSTYQSFPNHPPANREYLGLKEPYSRALKCGDRSVVREITSLLMRRQDETNRGSDDEEDGDNNNANSVSGATDTASVGADTDAGRRVNSNGSNATSSSKQMKSGSGGGTPRTNMMTTTTGVSGQSPLVINPGNSYNNNSGGNHGLDRYSDLVNSSVHSPQRFVAGHGNYTTNPGINAGMNAAAMNNSNNPLYRMQNNNGVVNGGGPMNPMAYLQHMDQFQAAGQLGGRPNIGGAAPSGIQALQSVLPPTAGNPGMMTGTTGANSSGTSPRAYNKTGKHSKKNKTPQSVPGSTGASNLSSSSSGAASTVSHPTASSSGNPVSKPTTIGSILSGALGGMPKGPITANIGSLSSAVPSNIGHLVKLSSGTGPSSGSLPGSTVNNINFNRPAGSGNVGNLGNIGSMGASSFTATKGALAHLIANRAPPSNLSFSSVPKSGINRLASAVLSATSGVAPSAAAFRSAPTITGAPHSTASSVHVAGAPSTTPVVPKPAAVPPSLTAADKPDVVAATESSKPVSNS
jgi:hypothetical protein